MATLDDIQRAYIRAQAAKDGSESRGDKSRHAVAPVEPTLGDRIPADKTLAGTCLPEHKEVTK